MLPQWRAQGLHLIGQSTFISLEIVHNKWFLKVIWHLMTISQKKKTFDGDEKKEEIYIYVDI